MRLQSTVFKCALTAFNLHFSELKCCLYVLVSIDVSYVRANNAVGFEYNSLELRRECRDRAFYIKFHACQVVYSRGVSRVAEVGIQNLFTVEDRYSISQHLLIQCIKCNIFDGNNGHHAASGAERVPEEVAEASASTRFEHMGDALAYTKQQLISLPLGGCAVCNVAARNPRSDVRANKLFSAGAHDPLNRGARLPRGGNSIGARSGRAGGTLQGAANCTVPGNPMHDRTCEWKRGNATFLNPRTGDWIGVTEVATFNC